MAPRDPYGDVEMMLLEYLEPRGHVVTSTPPKLKELLADGYVIRVARVGGGESGNKSSDEPRVNVQVFALRSSTKPRDAIDGAALIRADLVLNLPAITDAGRIDSGTTESGPTAFPWPDPEITVVQMILRLATRR